MISLAVSGIINDNIIVAVSDRVLLSHPATHILSAL